MAESVPDYVTECDRPVRGMRIAWSPTLGFAKAETEITQICEAAVKTLESAGCIVEQVDRVMDDPCDLWMSEFYASIGTRLRNFSADKLEMLDPAVSSMFSKALDQSLEQYYRNVFERYNFREQLRQFFKNYDLLATPTLPVAAFDVGLNLPPSLAGRNIVTWVDYTYPFNLTGQPAASIPAGQTEAGLPVGLQLVGRMHHESDLFRRSCS